EAIQHPDIRSLYRRELLDRFSALAFPRREFHKAPRQKWSGAPARSGASESLRRTAASNTRDSLAQAVLAGLERHPDQIARHAEALLALGPSEPQFAGLIDELLEGAGNRTISAPSSSGCGNESWKSSRDSGRWPGNAPPLRQLGNSRPSRATAATNRKQVEATTYGVRRHHRHHRRRTADRPQRGFDQEAHREGQA